MKNRGFTFARISNSQKVTRPKIPGGDIFLCFIDISQFRRSKDPWQLLLVCINLSSATEH